ncbi:hypothetical protein MW887_005772 [Aspergillus wentii]|nr:hypothetical protein MW887_005772 [Aspergillus wentii]
MIVASNPDPDIERSNNSYEHWINRLTQAFNALGGESWLLEQRDTLDVSDEDEEEVIFATKSSTLSLGVSSGESQEDEEEEEASEERGEGQTPRIKATTAAPAPSLDQVPLESYHIPEDQIGVVTDYLVAVYSFSKQCIELRHYLQGIWRDVAYNDLNSAVAATVSNISIGMIQDTQSQVFVDFTGHESFETIMKTITRGDPDKAHFKM